MEFSTAGDGPHLAFEKSTKSGAGTCSIAEWLEHQFRSPKGLRFKSIVAQELLTEPSTMSKTYQQFRSSVLNQIQLAIA